MLTTGNEKSSLNLIIVWKIQIKLLFEAYLDVENSTHKHIPLLGTHNLQLERKAEMEELRGKKRKTRFHNPKRISISKQRHMHDTISHNTLL
jgi:Spy/CpxP family protein refolding chaperone